jgi:hypothetical protein
MTKKLHCERSLLQKFTIPPARRFEKRIGNILHRLMQAIGTLFPKKGDECQVKKLPAVIVYPSFRRQKIRERHVPPELPRSIAPIPQSDIGKTLNIAIPFKNLS